VQGWRAKAQDCRETKCVRDHSKFFSFVEYSTIEFSSVDRFSKEYEGEMRRRRLCYASSRNNFDAKSLGFETCFHGGRIQKRIGAPGSSESVLPAMLISKDDVWARELAAHLRVSRGPQHRKNLIASSTGPAIFLRR
jgi:hypothetical protein